MSLEKKENSVKWYGVIIGLVSLALQHGIYLLGHILATYVFKIEPFLPKINVIDDAIPLVSAFIIPYVWSYAYWAMAPMAVSKCETKHFKNYLASYLFSCLLGAVILALAPTYMDREAEGLFITLDDNFFEKLRQFWYTLDGAKIAYNLLPSFHCINSTISYLGVCGRKEIPFWFRAYSLVITIVIYLSTMFVKQHYFLDVISGVAIAVIVFFICKKFDLGRVFDRPAAFFKKKFAKKQSEE